MRLTITAKDIAESSSGPKAIERALRRTQYKFKFVGVYYIFYENQANPLLMCDRLRDFVDNFPHVSPLWTTL